MLGPQHRYFCAGMASELTGDGYSYCVVMNRHHAKRNIGFKVAVYLACIALDAKHNRVGDLFNISRSTAAKYVADIEDRRAEWREFSEKLYAAERRVQAEFAGQVAG